MQLVTWYKNVGKELEGNILAPLMQRNMPSARYCLVIFFETMIKGAVYEYLGNADITDEEFITAFTGAEALLNSRPLAYQPANPEDDVPLTPSYFPVSQVGGQFAPESVDETTFSPKKRWKRVPEVVRHFWHRWTRAWLPALNVRRE